MSSEPDSPAGDSATIRKTLAERARYEREVAALDLSDAEQAEFRSVPHRDLAAELYDSADRHRQLAVEFDSAIGSGGVNTETASPMLPDA